MLYGIVIKRKTLKSAAKMPQAMQAKLALLIDDLRDKGPVLPHWQNYSELGQNKYHCHLGRKWVACWLWKDGTITIEVYYVGSRENAPY